MNEDTSNYKIIEQNGCAYIFNPLSLEIIKIPQWMDINKACRILTDNSKDENTELLLNSRQQDREQEINDNYKIISLDIAHGCTLRCKYCYLTAGNIKKRYMSKEFFLDILDFLSKDKKISLTFYFAGEGEPTLNFDLLKQIPTLCREKGFKKCTYEITTNGTLLTEDAIAFFKKENIAISVSLDGDAINDENRVFPNGSPSFGVVMEKIEMLKRFNMKFACKSVIIPSNRNLLNMTEFFNRNQIPFYFGFATRSFDGQYVPKMEHVEILRQQLRIVGDYYEKRIKSNLYVYSRKLIEDLRRIHYRITTTRNCDAAYKSFFIDIDGDIYSCSCLNCTKELSVGNINTGIDYEKIKAKSLYPKNVNAYMSCKNCWLRHLCSGSCIAVKWLESRDTNITSKYLCAINNLYWDFVIRLYINIYPYIKNNINFRR